MKNSILSKNIRKLRAFKNLNQTEFANLFDIKRASIGAYEEGRAEPKLETLIKFASYFSLKIDDLVTKELTVNQIAKFDKAYNKANETKPIVVDKELKIIQKKLIDLEVKLDLLLDKGKTP